MKMIYKFIVIDLVVFFMLTLAVGLKADTSIFSSLGIGDINPSSMYSTGICYDDSTIIKPHNFVNWADIDHMHYTLSFDFNIHEAKTEAASSSHDGVQINGFNLAIPFGNRNTFGISLTPYSTVNISSFMEENTIADSNAFGQITYDYLTKKTGGINNLTLVYAKRINNLSFSTNITGKFGHIAKEVQYSLDNGTFSNYYYSDYRTNISNLSLGAGIKYRINNKISLSGLFDIPIYSDVTEYVSHTNVDEVKTDIPDTEWPMTIGAGMFYKPNQFSFSSEFLFTNFKGKNLGFYDETTYNDFFKLAFSVGFSNYTNKLSSYYKRIKYNLDLAYIQQPYLYNNSAINDLSAIVGLTFPYNNERSSIKLDAGIVKSGDLSSNTIEGLTYKFGLTFNGSGNWWLRTKRYDD